MEKVSIVVPVYNAMRTIEATVVSALAQTYRNTEVIIVDDGSTDDSARFAEMQAARDPRVKVIRRDNSGVATARNVGIAAATGQWVAPLDADDIWHPEKIERQVRVATAARLPLSFIYTWSRRIDIDGIALMDLGRPQFRGDVLGPLIASNFMRNSSVPLIRRDALEAVGGYDADLKAAGAQGAEDLSIYLKLAEHGPVDLEPSFMVGYRYFSGTMSRDGGRMRRSIDLVLEQLCQRRPGIPPELLSLAKMNYDFYSATLAGAAGDWVGFARYIARALAARPMVGAAFLISHLIERLFLLVSRPRGIRFEDLSPDELLRRPSVHLLDALQASAAQRAARMLHPITDRRAAP